MPEYYSLNFNIFLTIISNIKDILVLTKDIS